MTVTRIFVSSGHRAAHGATQWQRRCAVAAAPTPDMTVGVHLAGADPAGAGSAPPGVGGGMHMQHHQPATSREGPGESRDDAHGARAGAGDGADGGGGSGGDAGDAGGRAAATGALRDARRCACSHGTRASTRERHTGWGG